uniref:CCR4-NOT transcription complex subunit 3 n=1 Tax=Meloidogyne javanica TaxID=6303 RepID=A0A915MXF9_MELJA
MAEKRKLLNEIDKCYKKIEEGFEIFDDIMAKMTEANSDNQREKFQDDLKKEIKKLQRLRDQIKGWQNSSEIKLIEQRMEIFKDVERENKMKPHSKQGLTAEDKLDPKEKEKCDTIEWLNCQIRRIQDEIDRTESKLETLSSSADTGKKRGKKEDAKKNEKEKSEELRRHLDRVKFHLLNLEVCIRMINNEKIEIKDVNGKLKEPLEMYIDALDPENDDDPESLDPEDIYEELNFSTYLSQLGGISTNSVDDEKGPNNDTGSHKSSSPSPDYWSKHQNGGELDTSSHEKSPYVGNVSTRSTSESASSHRSAVSNSSSVSSPLPQTPPAIPGIPYNSVAAGKMHTPPVQSTAAMATHPMHQAVTNTASTPTASTSANILASPKTTLASPSAVENTSSNVIVQQQQPPSTIQAPPTVSPVAELKEENAVSSSGMASTTLIRTRSSSVTSSTATSLHEETSQFSTVVGGGGGNLTSSPITSKAPLPLRFSSAAAGGGATTSSSSNPSPFSLPTFMSAASSAPPSTTTPAGRTSDLSTPSRNSEQHQESQHSSNDVGNNVADTSEFNGKVANLLYNSSFGSPMITQKSREPQEAVIQPWLGASPLGMAPINEELSFQLQMLDATQPRCPLQMDSEKPRSYLPKMPCSTPPYYPQAPLPNADSLEYYLRLSVETLFFTFYYMEGSRAQLLAAKALKKLSWRYLMWFQRHEEPKQITDDYEQGTYVYFDFEKWVQRKKEQFTFEYKYLEDKDFE